VNSFVGKLVSGEYTAIAKNAAGHVQLNIGTQIVLFKCTPWKFISGTFLTMFITQVLQVAFPGLVADGTIQGMVDEEEFNNAIPGVDYFFTGNIFHFHAIHYIGAAGSHQFGHRSGISSAAFGNFHQTGAAFTTRVFQLAVITHCRRSNLPTNLAGSIEYAGTLLHLNGDVVNGYFE
jgi:hypothetical protein